MQPVTGYASTAGDEAPLDRARIARASSQTLDHAPRQPADDTAPSPADKSVPLGYTSSARSVTGKPAGSGRISVFA